MKNLISFIIILVTIGNSVNAQSTDKNYIHSTIPNQPYKTESQLNAVHHTRKVETITYFDGLGREKQIVQKKASPNHNDIVQPIEYDQFGKTPKKYLPYTEDGTGNYKNAAITAQSYFYKTSHRVARSNFPFSETVFDNSPLNRVNEVSAPGLAWRLTNNHTVQSSFRSNALNEVRKWDIVGNNYLSNNYYLTDELYVTQKKDENGNNSFEFNDKNGRAVLSNAEIQDGIYLSTYYVYNDFGNIEYVIPPKAVKKMENTGSWDINGLSVTDKE